MAKGKKSVATQSTARGSARYQTPVLTLGNEQTYNFLIRY